MATSYRVESSTGATVTTLVSANHGTADDPIMTQTPQQLAALSAVRERRQMPHDVAGSDSQAAFNAECAVAWETLRAFSKLEGPREDSQDDFHLSWLGIFSKVDPGGEGTVGTEGLRAAMGTMGLADVDEAVLAAVVAGADKRRGDGLVDYRELLRSLRLNKDIDAVAFTAAPKPTPEAPTMPARAIPEGTDIPRAAAAAATSPDGGPLLAALKNAGADMNASVRGKTLLHLAAWEGVAGTVSALASLGACVHQADRHGAQPLHFAVCRGREGAMRALLAAGAAADARTTKGDSPLHVAAQHGQAEMCVLLVREFGADVDATNEHQCTPLMLAAMAGHAAAVALLAAEAGAGGLGADMGLRGRDGFTALHLAGRSGHAAVCDALVKAGADVDAERAQRPVLARTALAVAPGKGAAGETALHCAAWGGHGGCCEALANLGANVYALDPQGYSALHLAALGGHASCLRALVLNCRADPTKVNPSGRTPEDIARANGRSEAAELLKGLTQQHLLRSKKQRP